MHAIVVSDIHVGWEESNIDDFKRFMRGKLRAINPDLFIINGDLMDYWRRDITSLTIEESEVFDDIEEVHNTGIDVELIAGNHDWRLEKIDSGRGFFESDVLDFNDRFRFKSGDRDFLVLHGHQGDAINASPKQNEALCLTDDTTASSLANLYSDILGKYPIGIIDILTPDILDRINLRVLEHVDNPDALKLKSNEARVRAIIRRLTSRYDGHIIFGHTHLDIIDKEFTNVGSWTGESNSYVEIIDGEVEIKEF